MRFAAQRIAVQVKLTQEELGNWVIESQKAKEQAERVPETNSR
jgi:hypothetical protein